MASSKVFLIFLLAALTATPVAVAQLGGLLGLIRIDGVLFCSLNGKMDVINGTTTPIFPSKFLILYIQEPRSKPMNIHVTSLECL